MTPGQDISIVIDYQTKAGRSLYGYATEKLNEDLFDCIPGEFYLLIKSLKYRAYEYVWTYSTSGVRMIPSDYGTRTFTNGNDPGNLHNIITDYGKMNLEDLTEYEITYVGNNIRRYQDDRAPFKCLMKIISADSKKNTMVLTTQLKLV